MVTLSKRVQSVSLSANAAARQLTRQLKEQGVDILDLTTGEPDFDTPAHIRQAAVAAMEAGETRYTPTNGTTPLRKAVLAKLKNENQLDYELAQICIANGAKQIIFNAFAATLNEGDEVIVPVPYWPTFPDSVRFNGGEAVLLACPLEQEYKLQPQQLAQAISAKTRWLVLNNPGNPSGMVYSEDELTALATVLRDHPNVLIMLDELYEHILFDGREHVSLLHVAPDLAERILLVGGVSKTYAMTGWRIGFGAGPKALIDAMVVVQSQNSSGASAISQAAAVAAYNGGLDFLPPQRAAYQDRRDAIMALLKPVQEIDVLNPDGAFFIFCRCAGLLGKTRPDGQRIESEQDVMNYLLESGVSGVAGSAYGLSPYFRLSIATDIETVRDAGRRIAQACAALK
ncbi:aminotransferase class I/II-fold pyridoxal phosphate-dependent enzyme [Pantoea sp. B9002]|uniref:aminotransferase class I/II-fold pyridoxal phosphate-dependent enzyme n=1 Tax=Pantoea sp. B9002 TaxID=2726979 RepID=UPI0015A3F96D|nr:aminotransferase class I/II-fold pyridoxal phosphate-dependent enzyme [Pantoea sp. B9002]NWA62071.1 aminotransferase class I/II-fold pyridoxal phosphate-dependent enzyme [Pantoea sp. B9002]